MILLSFAMAALPASGLGAAYPGVTPDRPVERNRCETRYGFVTADPMAKVIAYYRAEAAAAGLATIGETTAKFDDFKILLFAQKPKLLSVTLQSAKGLTTARIFFHRRIPPGCA